MRNPNKGASEEVLRRFKEESYERFRIELFNSVKALMDEFDMTWDDLAESLKWVKYRGETVPVEYYSGDEVMSIIGAGKIDDRRLNEIAHCFSAECYLIFRPRPPYTKT